MSDNDLATQARREVVDGKAREWLSYLYSGDITEQGRAGFLAWLAENPEHRRAFQMINDIWTSLDRVRDIENALPGESINSASLGKPTEAPVRSRWRRAWRSAAIAAGLAAIVTFASLNFRDPIDRAHVTTGVGEIRALDLTDGSQLVLRPDTEIVASMSSEERNITLERGGAYFDVSRDEIRPFVVSAAGIDVRVHGTAFDVLKGPSSVTISVTHGRVAVSDHANRNRDGMHSVALTGGQQVTVAADGTFGAITEFDPKRVLGWRDGRLSYFNARLEDIIADINRYRTVKISIEDEKLKDLRITTMFRVENTDQMLAGIEATEPVTIVRSSSSIVISRRAAP